MKILVAGKGFIGRAVGQELESTHEVEYLDRKEAEHEYDITESFSLEEEFDVVIHTIGLAPGFSSAEQYRNVHVRGTRNLLDAVDADRIIYLSAMRAGEIDHSFFRTKKKAEEIIQRSGIDHTIIRPSTVYGTGNMLLEMIGDLSPTRIFPNLGNRTQPIMIDDLVEMVDQVVAGSEKEVLRAGGPEKMTMGELARKIYQEEDRRCFLLPVPRILLEIVLIALSFLPPPFQRENIEILRHDNVTDQNDAENMVSLSPID